MSFPKGKVIINEEVSGENSYICHRFYKKHKTVYMDLALS